METLLEYKLSHRHGILHYKLAQRMSFLPTAIVLVLFYAHGAKSGPGLWMALGCAASIQLMLWSGYALHRASRGRSAWSTRMVQRSDTWFPSLLIVMQGALVAVTLLIFWSTLLELGHRGNRLHTVLICALLILLPVRRIYRLKFAEVDSATNEVAFFFLHYLHWILVTVFVASTLATLMLPEQSLSSDSHVGTLAIWVPATLIVISCIVLFVDHVLRKMPKATRPRAATDTLD